MKEHPLLDKVVDRFVKVESVVTITLVAVACWGFTQNIVPVELFSTWVGAVITYFFTRNKK